MPYATSAAAVDSRYFLLDGTRNITGPTTIINNVPLLASDVLTIRGAAGQTGKLLTLENSALTDVFTVDNAGAIVGASLTLTGNIVLGNTSKVIGGSSTTADLTLQTTSGVGASGADMHFLVGNAGATEAITVLNNGRVGINNTAPRAVLTIGNDDPYTGGLYVASFGGFIARYSNVFEFVTGVNPTVGQGIRVDGANRKVNLHVSTSITSDNEALEIDTVNSATLFNGPTTGSKTFIQVGSQAEFKPTSGSATMTWLRIRGLVNQTGGANGITRGLYINTTITAAADWRSLEITPNTGYAVYQEGALAKNYFAGNVGAGTLTPATKVHAVDTDAATNTVVSILTLGHNSSATPVAGFGTGVLFQAKSSTTSDQAAAAIEALWQTATHASRSADLVLSAYNVANKREGVRVRGGASGAELAFFGGTPAAKPSLGVWAGLTTDQKLDALRDALNALSLASYS